MCVCVCEQAMCALTHTWGGLQRPQSCRTEAQPAHFLYRLPFPRAAGTTGEPNSPQHHRSHYIITVSLHHMSAEAFRCDAVKEARDGFIVVLSDFFVLRHV